MQRNVHFNKADWQQFNVVTYARAGTRADFELIVGKRRKIWYNNHDMHRQICERCNTRDGG